MSSLAGDRNEDNLNQPRILCLHGGGVTAAVFRAQARSVIRALPDFRLVFADGPFFCDAGPGIIPTYQDCGPFRRWLRWLPEHPEIDDEAAIEEIRYSLATCKAGDAGTGPWVGIIGFSQGAKLTSSILYDQQIRVEHDGPAGIADSIGGSDFKFGVLLAGRSPIVSFCKYSDSPALVRAGAVSEGFHYPYDSPHVLEIPTIHLHGLSDPGLELHRKMFRQYHDPTTAKLLEWDGAHRVPFKLSDVEPLAREIYRLARQQGVEV